MYLLFIFLIKLLIHLNLTKRKTNNQIYIYIIRMMTIMVMTRLLFNRTNNLIKILNRIKRTSTMVDYIFTLLSLSKKK
jgi:hypothetical protein